MTFKTDFNVSPYFDDYNEEKNFHRILFKPSIAVQARELTQLQTILQNQVERFGDFVFKDGSIVKGVSQRHQRVFNIKLQDAQANGGVLNVADLVQPNTYIKGATTGILAEIVAIEDGAEVAAPDYKTLFLRYITSGSNGTDKEFQNDEELFLVETSNTNVKRLDTFNNEYGANTLKSGASGNSLLFTVGDGLVYQKGAFIRVESQSKVIGKYTLYPSTAVGFDIKEELINSFVDDSLNDNAIGSTNFQAPGADRLKLNATLTQRSLTGDANTDPFFPISEFKNGVQTKTADRADLNELGNRLAERTYEESGDYILSPFNIRIQEHLNSNTNFGVYNSDSSIRGVEGDENKLVASIQGGGVAYVRGFRNEIRQGIPVDIDKGIDFEFNNAQAVTMDLGGFVRVDEFVGEWSHTEENGVTVELHDTAYNSVSSLTFASTTASGTKIGEAKFATVRYQSGDGAAAQYRVYLFDIEMNAGQSFQSVRSLYIPNSIDTGKHSFADVVLVNGNATIEDSNKSKLIWNFGTRAMKTLRDLGGASDTQFQSRSNIDVSLPTSGIASGVTIQAGVQTGTQPESVTGSSESFIVTFKEDAETASLGTTYIDSGDTSMTMTTASLSDFAVGDIIDNGHDTFLVTAVGSSDLTVSPAASQNGHNSLTIKKFPAGYVIDMGVNGTNGNRSISGTNQSIDLNIQETLTTSPDIEVSYKVLKTQSAQKTKDTQRSKYVGIDMNTASGGTTGPWTLGISDVFRIVSIFKGTTYSESGLDVTDQFNLNTNQQDTHYENSFLTLAPSSDLTFTSADKLTVILDYFDHTQVDGVGFFSVDSYTTGPYPAINAAEIPVFKSPSTGIEYDLRDSVDFRPRYQNQTSGGADIGTIVTVDSPNTTLDFPSGTKSNYLPVVDTNFQADLQYYLPRIDKLVLSKDGQVYVAKGISSLNPQAPRDQGDAITLAQINIPPFPSLASGQGYNRPDYQTRLSLKRYKRFTMRDIGKIEERLSRLEYYSALNLLEQSAKDISELNGLGAERFKNGFFAEPFVGHQYGEVNDENYSIAIDTAEGEARPKFNTNLVEVSYNKNNSTNVVDRPLIALLEIDSGSDTFWNFVVSQIDEGDEVRIFQGSNFGSATVTAKAKHYGSGSPRQLYVEDIAGTTGIFVNGDVKIDVTGNPTGQVTNVTAPDRGKLITLPYSQVSFIKQPMASKLRNPTGEISFNWAGRLNLQPSVDTWKDETTIPEVQIELDLLSNFESVAQAFGTQWGEWTDLPPVTSTSTSSSTTGGNWWTGTTTETTTTTTTTNQRQRSGTAFEVRPGSQTFDAGEFVTDVTVQPFMRSRLIKVNGVGVRPNTKLWAFFDEVPVTEYVQQWNNDYSANTSDFGTNVVTDETGRFSAKFRIPNDAQNKFTIGTKQLKFVDVADLVTGAEVISTSAVADYTASGLALSKQGLSITTQTGEFVQTNPTQRSEPIVSTDVSVNRTRSGGWWWNFGGFSFDDPLAQTFTMPTTQPSGFISKINLFFQAKDSVYGIDLQIREVQNGTITQQLVPFGVTTLQPEDIQVSEDASVPTPFYFPTPLHLAAGKEYAMVIYPHGGSPNYRCWVSELGGVDVTTNRLISKQPSSGVLYTSSNDKVYNAFQSEDVKFEIFRASFDTTAAGIAAFENDEFENFKIANRVGSFVSGELLRGASVLTTSNIGDGTLGTSTGSGTDIDVGSQVRGLTSGSVGTVREIVGAATANVITVRVDNANNFTDTESVRFTTTSGLVAFGGANGVTSNTSTAIVQQGNYTLNKLVANNTTGDFVSNTTSFDGWVRGQQSNAVAQITNILDYKTNVITPRLAYIDYGNTAISFEHNIAGNTSYSNSTTTSVTIGGINQFLEEKVVASKSNSTRSYFLRSRMRSSTDYFSPVIDIDKTPSAIAVHNLINDPYSNTGLLNASETNPLSRSEAKAVYISKPIVLADGQDSEDIKVYVTGYKPQDTNIQVMVRMLSASDPEGIDDKHYTLLDQITPANVISSSTNEFDYRDYEYGLPIANTTAQGAFRNLSNDGIVRYGDEGGATYDTYKTFNVKVILTGENSAITPKMTDMRVIALQV